MWNMLWIQPRQDVISAEGPFSIVKASKECAARLRVSEKHFVVDHARPLGSAKESSLTKAVPFLTPKRHEKTEKKGKGHPPGFIQGPLISRSWRGRHGGLFKIALREETIAQMFLFL